MAIKAKQTTKQSISEKTFKNQNIDDEFESVLRANNIYSKKYIDENIFNKINRFGYLDPHNTLTYAREYLFFVKPDLHIFENGDTSKLNPEIYSLTIFRDALLRYKEVLKQLQASANNTSSQPFMSLLSNTVNSKLDLPSITADNVETGRNIYGSAITYRQNSLRSDTDFDFTLEFKDTKHLDVYMLFKLFDEYERKKFTGEVTPPNEDYIINKILHDQMAIYKIIVGEDGESILYWAKLVGVYPTSVPRDSFSSVEGNEPITFSVSFRCSFVEDMNPDILRDFNRTVRKTNADHDPNNSMPVFNNSIGMVDGDWSICPFIARDKNKSAKYPWRLKWRKG